LSVEEIKNTLLECSTVITSHYSKIRLEVMREEPYTSADRAERVEILRLLEDRIRTSITPDPEITPLQYTTIMETYNEVVATIRSLEIANTSVSRDSASKLQKDRDTSDLRFSHLYNLFSQEQRATED
tara:strand:+ start:1079 stop:1462 length:384 start_codon:yes stop_codon:yes gene_type:complete